jgi:perosamine synthetase
MRKRIKPINLFYPHVPMSARKAARKVLNTRWIGQGPLVDRFEELWTREISSPNTAISTSSGTAALHLAYILAGIKKGDEVICPVFTCTATNLPILYQEAKPVFADVNGYDLNINVESVKKLITKKTKAIVCVDYGGLPCELDELRKIARKHKIPLIEDAAQAQGAIYKGKLVGSIADFTCTSFQAIKIITTCDGGMLTIKNKKLVDMAKVVRWFGIDRKAKFEQRWKNDIVDLGYKYQMTDVAASMGIAALGELAHTLKHHRKLFNAYKKGLKGIPGIEFIGETKDQKSACWLCTVFVENREAFEKKLREYNIETNQTHYRNDRYTIFGGRVKNCPNMDAIEDNYLLLPMHYKLKVKDIEYICKVIRLGW